jgi:hypothetical protein
MSTTPPLPPNDLFVLVEGSEYGIIAAVAFHHGLHQRYEVFVESKVMDTVELAMHELLRTTMLGLHSTGEHLGVLSDESVETKHGRYCIP